MSSASFRLISDELKQALGDFLPEGLTLVEARAVYAVQAQVDHSTKF